MIVVTGNSYKFNQIKEFFPEAQQRAMDLVEIQSLDPEEIIRHKLDQSYRESFEDVLVEDTALVSDGLNGLPGPFVKFFLETVGCEGIWHMVETTGNTTAQAISTLGFRSGAEQIIVAQGIIPGKIVSPRGHGHGWNSIFQPDGSDLTYAEMTVDQHREYNMRVLALQELQIKLGNKSKEL